ncbi:MAG: hypothetical protein ACI4RD_07150 [Kiritimatiellia bacterium]
MKAYMLGMAALFAGAASAAPVIGPGVRYVDAAEDLVWADSVPAMAAQTLRPGVFFPTDAEGNGPKNVETVVFRNVRLSDIESFSAKFGVNLAKDDDSNRKCSAYRWEDALVVTNNATADSIEVQFHHRRLNSSYGTKAQFLFRQTGDDVAATLKNFTYFYIQSGQIPGESWIGGVALTNLVDSLYAVGDQSRMVDSGHCVGYLGCTLKADCGKQAVPDEIVFRSTAGDPEPVTVKYVPYLSNDFVVIAKNLYATNLVSASAILTGGEVKGEYLREASCLTNDTKLLEKVFVIQRMAGTRRVGATVRVAQSNEYVLAKIQQAYHQYDGTKTENDPLGNYFYGAAGGVLSTVTSTDGAGVALRDLTFTFAADDVLVSSSPDALSHTHQLVWPGVRLAEVEPGPALIGGSVSDGSWNRVFGWFTTNLVEDAVVQTYYQRSNGWSLWTVRTEFQQQEDGVYASVVSLRWTSTTQSPPCWVDGINGNYQLVLTNAVDGTKTDEGFHTVALSGITARRRRYATHTATLADGAQTGEVPVRLLDMNLALAPAEGALATLPKSVSGDGRVVLASGTTLVAADRSLSVPVEVAADATLAFAATDEGAASLAAPEIVLADGARLGLWADAPLTGMTATATKTFALPAPAGATADLEIALLGDGFADCKVRGLTIADGVLSVSVGRKTGCVIIVR